MSDEIERGLILVCQKPGWEGYTSPNKMSVEIIQSKPIKKAKTDAKCLECVWVEEFKPRKDEIERGLILGCKKPGWEGYTSPNKPSCDGVFFYPKDRD